jgi:hypothetical protein
VLCPVELSLQWLSDGEVLAASFAGLVLAVKACLGLAMPARIGGVVQSRIVVI